MNFKPLPTCLQNKKVTVSSEKLPKPTTIREATVLGKEETRPSVPASPGINQSVERKPVTAGEDEPGRYCDEQPTLVPVGNSAQKCAGWSAPMNGLHSVMTSQTSPFEKWSWASLFSPLPQSHQLMEWFSYINSGPPFPRNPPSAFYLSWVFPGLSAMNFPSGTFSPN